MKAAVIAVSLIFMSLQAMAFQKTCRVMELKSASGGHMHTYALVAPPCMGWGKTAPRPKGYWISKTSAGKPFLNIKWRDAIRAGIVKEVGGPLRYSKGCEPVLSFVFDDYGKTSLTSNSYVIGVCQDKEMTEAVKRSLNAKFGDDGFEFSKPDATGAWTMRDKATGRTYRCQDGNCS